VLAAELRAVSGLAAAGGSDTLLPVHLVGVPACLHKYEALLRDAWSERRAPALPAA
jgi:hypothetical protein